MDGLLIYDVLRPWSVGCMIDNAY